MTGMASPFDFGPGSFAGYFGRISEDKSRKLKKARKLIKNVAKKYEKASENKKMKLEKKIFKEVSIENHGLEDCLEMYTAYMKGELPEEFLFKYRQYILKDLDNNTLSNIIYRHIKTVIPLDEDIIDSARLKRLDIEEEQI